MKSVLKQVKPTPTDRKRLEQVAAELIGQTNAACAKLDIDAKAMLVGSAARDTWLRFERDIDVFILTRDKRGAKEKLQKVREAVMRRFGNVITEYILTPHGFEEKRGTLTIKEIMVDGELIIGKPLGEGAGRQ